MTVTSSRYIIILLSCCITLGLSASDTPVFAQNQDTLSQPAAPTDTTPQIPPGQQQSQAGEQPEGNTVNFQANDSLVFDFSGNREATLFGSSNVSHSSGDLTAGKIILNLNRNTISAKTLTPEDTLSQPVLQRGDQKIRSERIKFNYETEKGRFDVARVKIEQGSLTGNKVKKAGGDVIYIEDARYSTCPLPHPHYYLKAERMKVVNREELFFTRAKLYILDIPYPMIFPFGYVPAKIEQRQSGILEPAYAFQNQKSRGIGLQNLGWFQYFNDYLTGRFQFDIYTSGTFLGNLRLNYAKRNDFNGSVKLGYSRERGLEPTDPGFNVRVNKQLSINHYQDFSPYASVDANINLRTADFFQRNSYEQEERGRTNTTSRLNYNYRDPGGNFNFNISGEQSVNFKDNTATFSAPNMNFSVNTFSPFQDETTTGPGNKWYENLNISYNNTFRTQYRFDPIRDDTARIGWFEALLDPQKYRQATGNNRHYRTGFRQSGSASLNNIIPSRFINASANFSANEYWYLTTIRKSFNPNTGEITERRVRDFQTARDFNTGVNFNTTLYGMWNQNIGNLVAFRHKMIPSIGFNYRPDFSEEVWGYYREVQVDTTGRTRKYSIFEDGVIGGPASGEQQSINFNLRNTLQAKQVKRDTTGEKREENLRLVDQFDANLSYNFAADSLRLSELQTNFSTNIIKDVDINGGASFNFYARNDEGVKIDRFLWEQSDRMAQLTSFNVRVSTRFSTRSKRGRQRSGQLREPDFPRRYDPFNQQAFRNVDRGFNSQPVSSFNSPFSFSLNFSYSWNYNRFGENRQNAILNMDNIRFKLTPKWDIRTSMGFDFIEKELTPSRFSLNRRLHMWSLSFEMKPFGDFQYYLFSLRVNDGQLQSLFQKLPILKNLRRQSGLNKGHSFR